MEFFLQRPFFFGPLASDRARAAFLAVVVHGAVFAAGSLGLMRGIEYGIDASDGMSEVDLIAAPGPAAEAITSQAVLQNAPLQQAPTLDEHDIVEPKKMQTPPALPTTTPVPHALLTTHNLKGPLGDGSSPVAGADATTVHRAGSSGAYFKAGYYRNPPPPYPPESRRLKQEGRVLLEVLVTKEGQVGQSRLKQSSGYPLLDEAALRAIQTWKFRPATLGGLRIEILADIPIRFQLK